MEISPGSAFYVGVEEIDAQHSELLDRLNSFMEACECGREKDELLPMLCYLDEYAREHFDAEEKLQRETGYPEAREHRREHGRFEENLREMKRVFMLEGITSRLALTVNRLLVQWLVEHITGKDADFGRFFQERGKREVRELPSAAWEGGV